MWLYKPLMENIHYSKVVNSRKSLRIRNRTNYFSPDSCRTYVRVSSPYSYQSRRVKIEGYETRLYYEFKYCESVGGQTFFYTLTYNDKAMPKYLGQNCFDYQDLVWLLNGGFKKRLLRNYGTNFKYFVGAELGEGAGSRGMENNPHYHVIFFLRPAEDSRYPYKVITPVEFRHLVREYWQGFDQDVDGFRPFEEARYGIAKEGSENLGLCTDYRAFFYCAKYVTKDIKLKKHEKAVERFLRDKYEKEFSPDNHDVLLRFYDDYFTQNTDIIKDWPMEICDSHILGIIEECGYRDDYDRYLRCLVDEQVRLGLNEYRNRFCNKCRISQGVGDYATKFIDDVNEPYIPMPDKKKGFKKRPISLYYYRKLFTEVVKDLFGRPIRVLNQLGFDYKNYQLNKQIQYLRDKTKALYDSFDIDLYTKAISSDINVDVTTAYHDFINMMSENADQIINRYAIYKLVYEDRFFSYNVGGFDSRCGFPAIDYSYDYYRFIEPAYYQVGFDMHRVNSFIACGCQNYISYDSHPYFQRYLRCFAVFDLLSDYLFVQSDIKVEKEAEERKRIRSFHKSFELKSFYKQFALCS